MENITRNKLHAEFIGILNEAFEKKTLDEWAEIFTANEIPFCRAQSWEEVLAENRHGERCFL
jgi:crotonobetainyl-CoA:carnitine CoA-transferase CaiB-like acyl-CoA transferase